MQIQTYQAEQTRHFGCLLGQQAQPGDVLLLYGDLGAGKTMLTKGIAQGLGIKRVVKSPTFTLIREYHGGRLPLYHMDLYRLEHSSALDLGIEDYLAGEGISVMEWPQFGRDVLPPTYLAITLKQDPQQTDQRTIILEPKGQRYRDLVSQVAQADQKQHDGN